MPVPTMQRSSFAKPYAGFYKRAIGRAGAPSLIVSLFVSPMLSLMVAFALWPAPGLAQPTSGAADPAGAAAASGAPAGFVAPTLPAPDESNAARAKTQPGNNAPFWRSVRDSGSVEGRVNLPGDEKGVLIQSFVQYPGSRLATAGEAWRQVRNELIIPYGGALLVITLVALAMFYLVRGSMGGKIPDSGRKIVRFTAFERAAHWVNATAFVLLALSGIVMAFGRYLLAPWFGLSLFGWLALGLKTMHNFVGPLFVVSLVIVFATFVKDNILNRSDLNWLRRAGGLFGGAEPPSGRFNAGEKLVFWLGVLLLGVAVTASGLILDQVFPGFAYRRGDMQIAHMVHGTAAMLMLALFFGHIYMGTVGMKGAYKAMKTGQVDESWAREHHELWYEDVAAGRVPAQRSGLASAAGPAPRELPPDALSRS